MSTPSRYDQLFLDTLRSSSPPGQEQQIERVLSMICYMDNCRSRFLSALGQWPYLVHPPVFHNRTLQQHIQVSRWPEGTVDLYLIFNPAADGDAACLEVKLVYRYQQVIQETRTEITGPGSIQRTIKQLAALAANPETP